MIVLDANILIRAVLGKRVRQLLETYAVHGIRFYAPEVAYTDAEKYLPALLAKRGKSNSDVSATLAYLQSLIEPIGEEAYVSLKQTRGSVCGAGTRRTGQAWRRPCLCPVQSDGGHRLLRNRSCGLDFGSS
jgi:hypothetical protein